MPFLVGRIVGNALVNARVVDEHVYLPAKLVEGGVPDVARCFGIGEISGDEGDIGGLRDAKKQLLERTL